MKKNSFINNRSSFDNNYYILNFLFDNSRDFANDYKVDVLDYINSIIFFTK